jgi:bifunctional DNA-binding transcriptional regulator/antitoxin component of YhaV-PrlF toxin-antitoxin module
MDNTKKLDMAGYSGTPLFKKLGIKPGDRLYVKNPPDNYLLLIQPIPHAVKILHRLSNNMDIIHFFSKSKSELVSNIPTLMNKIKQDGMIWVSWPKKASKVATDITEDTIREITLPLGLVDIKVCAVDDIWSGLKLVIRKENRKT